MEQVQQRLDPPAQGYSMQYIQHPQHQRAMQVVVPPPSTHQRQDSGYYSQSRSPQTYGPSIHRASQVASPTIPSQHSYNGFMAQRPGVGPPNSSMYQKSDIDAGFADFAINHIMKRFGSQFSGYESMTQKLCGKVDSIQSQVSQLDKTVTSFWRDINVKLETTTRSPTTEQRTTEVGGIIDPSKTVGAIRTCESGQVVAIQGKADISASNNEEHQDPFSSDQRPDVRTEGQDSSSGIFHGSLRQRLDCVARMVSNQQGEHTAITDCFNKVFEMLQSVTNHSADVVTKQELEALRMGTRRDLEVFRKTLRQDLEADRKATVQDSRTLFEELRQDLVSFRGEIKQDLKSFRGEIKQDFSTIREKQDQHKLATEDGLKECLTNQTNTSEVHRTLCEELRQELGSLRGETKEDLESIRRKHDQHVLNTDHRLQECLANQTITLEGIETGLQIYSRGEQAGP